jgi:hypothetical protein
MMHAGNLRRTQSTVKNWFGRGSKRHRTATVFGEFSITKTKKQFLHITIELTQSNNHHNVVVFLKFNLSSITLL